MNTKQSQAEAREASWQKEYAAYDSEKELWEAGFDAGVLFAQGQWVSVEEQLPEDGRLVLVTVPVLDGKTEVLTDWWRPDQQEWTRYRGVIAWQDTPAPYQQPDEALKDIEPAKDAETGCETR